MDEGSLTNRELCDKKLDAARDQLRVAAGEPSVIAGLAYTLVEALVYQLRELYDITYEVRDAIDELLQKLQADDADLTVVLNELRQTLDGLQLKKR